MRATPLLMVVAKLCILIFDVLEGAVGEPRDIVVRYIIFSRGDGFITVEPEAPW